MVSAKNVIRRATPSEWTLGGMHGFMLLMGCGMWSNFAFLHKWGDNGTGWYVPYYVMEAFTLTLVQVYSALEFGGPPNMDDINLANHRLNR